jgi:hypothetical protein
MKSLTINHPEGGTPYTLNVSLADAATHVAARDKFADEANILLAYDRAEGGPCENPVAYKYADPMEDARLIYGHGEVDAIRAEDPGLIVELEIV